MLVVHTAMEGLFSGYLVLFVVFGVVSDAMNISLVLESTSWLLLAIFFCLSGIASWIAWALAVHLDAIEAKSKKEK